MNVSFQIKNSRKKEGGNAPLYVRITINGLRTEFSTKRYIDPIKWNNKAGVAKGSSEESKSINSFIASIRDKLYNHYNLLLATNKPITAELIKNAYFGIKEKGKTLVEVFEYHNKQVKELIGKDFASGTYVRYCTALKHCQEFMLHKYKVSDMSVQEINHEFITELEYWLKTVKKCAHNSAIKYITNFKKIIRICLGNGWIEKDPFINYRFRLNEVERDFLTQAEIKAIMDKTFVSVRLEQVRDIFIFCCYTGLAYADVKKLSKDHIVKSMDGESWIRINRTKTDTRSSIPLLDIPLKLIDKYSANPKCIAQNKLLPVNSNQKLNEYLKEIAAVCNINKVITTHIARHTFATTVTLTNGVPIESVSKMLGHKNLSITQHYSKVIDRKLSDDMKVLRNITNEPEAEMTA